MDAVLNTPELLDLILSSFPTGAKPSILLNCALVCKSWTWIALAILWGRQGYINRSKLEGREVFILGQMAKLVTLVSPTPAPR